MRGARALLVGLEVLAALNAVGGGLYALAGARDVPREWLEGTPFDDYTIPGILLLVGAGVMVVAATMVLLGARAAAAFSGAAGALLVMWIVVQVAMIGYVSWLQPASFAAGLAIIALASVFARNTRELKTPRGELAGRSAVKARLLSDEASAQEAGPTPESDHLTSGPPLRTEDTTSRIA